LTGRIALTMFAVLFSLPLAVANDNTSESAKERQARKYVESNIMPRFSVGGSQAPPRCCLSFAEFQMPDLCGNDFSSVAGFYVVLAKIHGFVARETIFVDENGRVFSLDDDNGLELLVSSVIDNCEDRDIVSLARAHIKMELHAQHELSDGLEFCDLADSSPTECATPRVFRRKRTRIVEIWVIDRRGLPDSKARLWRSMLSRGGSYSGEFVGPPGTLAFGE